MTLYIALLRAINVSGKNIIKMAELKQMFESMGFGKVQTYIQSGNVLFEADAEPAVLRERIEAEIERVFGLTVTVILRTPAELDGVVSRCPFTEVDQLYVVYLEGEPTEAGIARLKEFPCQSEQWQIRGQELYVVYGEGAHKSKLTNALIEKRLGMASTARNWRTTLKLVELANGE